MELFRALTLQSFDLDFKSVFICGLLPALASRRDCQPLLYSLWGLWKTFTWMLIHFLGLDYELVPFLGGKTRSKPQAMLSEQCFDLAGAHVKSNCHSLETAAL